MGFQSHPVELSEIKLDSMLQSDVETIARNIHET